MENLKNECKRCRSGNNIRIGNGAYWNSTIAHADESDFNYYGKFYIRKEFSCYYFISGNFAITVCSANNNGNILLL